MPITPKGVDNDPKAKADYEKAINKLLTDFQVTPVSKEIYKAIIDTKKQLTIMPESLRPAGSFERGENLSRGQRGDHTEGSGRLDAVLCKPGGQRPRSTVRRQG